MICRFCLLGLAVLSAGCSPLNNPTPPHDETAALQNIIPLTHGFDRAGEAYFSNDLRWIIFQAAPPGETNYQMFVAPLERDASNQINGIGAQVRISPPNSRNTCGYFSPDGNSLIFASTAGKEDPNEPTSGYQRAGRDYRWSFPNGMDIFRADGWQAAVAAADPAKGIDLAQHRLTDDTAYDAECAYSPDGRWIVFTSKRTGDLEIDAMRADGGDRVQLTHSPGYDGGPFFSPDGRHLIYRADRQNNNLLQIFSADLMFDSSHRITGLRNEKQLTHDANVNWGPYWHPDGKHIIYATSRHGHANYELYLMRSDGTRQTRITFAAGADVLPVFSPDGKYLAWASKRDGKSTQVYLARFTLPKGS